MNKGKKIEIYGGQNCIYKGLNYTNYTGFRKCAFYGPRMAIFRCSLNYTETTLTGKNLITVVFLA